MKAVQIQRYAKQINAVLCEVPLPQIADSELLIRVKAAAVNPLELLILTGSVRLIQDYPMPLTLGNECSGVVEEAGKSAKGFAVGDRVYTRLPLNKIGAFAEYVAVDAHAVAKMPSGYSFTTAAAIPLTGLTAYQGIVEQLEAKPGQTLLILGGSGSFGEMAVPIAKHLGLRVIVTGNSRARERFLAMGAEQYLDYQKENYWQTLSGIDHVIDTLGVSKFDHALSVLKPGGAAAEPADRSEPDVCRTKQLFPPQEDPVYIGRCKIRCGGAKAEKGISLFIRSCGWCTAQRGHPNCRREQDHPRH